MTGQTVTIDSKTYDFDCLDEKSKDYILMITEIKRELNDLARKGKILKAGELKLTEDLGKWLAEKQIKSINITEPETGP